MNRKPLWDQGHIEEVSEARRKRESALYAQAIQHSPPPASSDLLETMGLAGIVAVSVLAALGGLIWLSNLIVTSSRLCE